MSSSTTRPGRALIALALGALLALAPARPDRAAAAPPDDGGVAIGRVRELLLARGRPAGGPMLATPVRPGDAADRAWIVLSDDGVWLVWGGVSGPLRPEEAQMLRSSCECDFALPAPTGLASRPPPRGI